MTDQPADSQPTLGEVLGILAIQQISTWPTEKLVENLEGCHYDCIGGPLTMNIVYMELVNRAKFVDTKQALTKSTGMAQEVPTVKVSGDGSLVIPLTDLDYLNVFNEIRLLKIKRDRWNRADEKQYQELRTAYLKKSQEMMFGKDD